eukprot:CAMPEP_0176220064 /NCGR_PEP_ID=MMETSP0121_2-20121125/19030_1 /TAXON_ID=160619 /ORGANISM="Kryptoperidinium foliaceum, Strain CCMP 1326" /LENGTH=103 /DNA_ID=CAMNT_0017559243 /DNA_START=162 /DNA_END=470 /DNA_ORIENTATION=+
MDRDECGARPAPLRRIGLEVRRRPRRTREGAALHTVRLAPRAPSPVSFLKARDVARRASGPSAPPPTGQRPALMCGGQRQGGRGSEGAPQERRPCPRRNRETE